VKELRHLNLEDVFDYYDKRILHGSGEWVKAECPLISHEDRNPSASVNLEAGKWRCWSCEGRGDAYDILKENESLAGLPDAIDFAEKHFESGGGAVRKQSRSSAGLLGPASARKGSGSWSPPWRLS
jgi:hypothetical protein